MSPCINRDCHFVPLPFCILTLVFYPIVTGCHQLLSINNLFGPSMPPFFLTLSASFKHVPTILYSSVSLGWLSYEDTNVFNH